MWPWSKKKEQKPKTLDQMNKEELKEFHKDMRKNIRESVREIDRQIYATNRLVKSAEKDLEKKVKEGCPKAVLRQYAKNAVQARKQKEKHMRTKQQIKGVEYSVNHMIMNIKMTKIMGKSTDIMSNMNNLAKVPEISKTIMDMQMQMEKHGLINEMIDDTMEEMDDDDYDVDEGVDELINNMEDKLNGTTKKKKIVETENVDKDLDDQIKNLAL